LLGAFLVLFRDKLEAKEEAAVEPARPEPEPQLESE
jgi:hypothetical protein